MKRVLLAALLVLAFAIPAFAIVPAFNEDNVEIGVEYNYSHQDIEDVNLVGISIGSLSGGLKEKTTNVKVWSFLATLGYKISEQLTPYAVLGTGFLNLDQELIGSISGESWSDTLGLLTTEFRNELGFMYGAGLRGDVLSFNNGIIVGYDARWTTMDIETSDRQATLLEEISADNTMKASIGMFSLDVSLRKYFDLREHIVNSDGTKTTRKKYGVDGIEPFIGGRWTHTDLNVKNEMKIGEGRCEINLNTESESQSNMISAIGGIKVKINKHLDASIGGIIGQENGVAVKVGYSF